MVAEHLRRPMIDDMVIMNMIKSSQDLHFPPWPFPVSAKLWSADHHCCTQRDCVCGGGNGGAVINLAGNMMLALFFDCS